MTNTLFLIPQLSKLLLLLSLSTRKHTSTASCAILSNFFEERRTQNHPQYLSWLSRTLFPTTFLEIAVYACTCLHHSAHPPPPPPKKKKFDHHHPDGHKYFAGKPERQKYFAYFRFALSVGHLYLFYASIREVALPYKTIVLWFYGGGRGCIHVEIPPVRKGGKGQAVTGVL